jgi:hypothetical protein
MQKELIQTQIAFFLKKEFNAFEALSLEIKKQLGETESQYLPVPSDAPSEIPRLMLKYSEFEVVVFKNRLDLIFQSEYETIKVTKIISILLETLGLSLARIGFVKRFFLQSDIELLKELFKSGKLTGTIKEITIQVNNLKKIDGIDCNSIERIEKGNITSSDGSKISKTGLIVLKDCNTLKEENLPDSWDKIATTKIIEEMNTEASNFVLV